MSHIRGVRHVSLHQCDKSGHLFRVCVTASNQEIGKVDVLVDAIKNLGFVPKGEHLQDDVCMYVC